jgi:hypothetical protein
MDSNRVSARPRWYGSSDRAHAALPLGPDPARSAGQHRATAGGRLAIRPTDFGRGPYRIAVLILLVAALAISAGATLALKMHGHRAHNADAAPAAARTPPLVQAAEAWLSTNLPHSAKVIADGTVRAALIDSGFPASAVTLPGNAVGCDAIAFVVVTRALESAATKDKTLAGCVRSALPIAVFGTGTAAVRIAETVPTGSRALAAQRAEDTYERGIASTALISNPSVQMSAAVRLTMSTGKLDLRAATVIAVLAGQAQVQIAAVLGDPAEIAAGLPARTVDLVLTHSAELAAVLATLSEPFRPSAIVRTGSDGYRLVWPFATAPVPGLK